jgi:L-fucose isomerase-like protein
VASEGDVLGAVTQIVARSLSGRTGALLDMTEPDLDADRLLVWHGGGGPLHLADGDGAAWIAHPMIGRADPSGPRFGAIADFVFAPGPVTLLRVSRQGQALFAMGGTVVPRDASGFAGCRGWLADMSVAGEPAGTADVVATVMAHGIEHHFVLVPGEHVPAALEFAAWTGMEPLRRRPFRNHLDAGDYA